jgi:hypothetical protein
VFDLDRVSVFGEIEGLDGELLEVVIIDDQFSGFVIGKIKKHTSNSWTILLADEEHNSLIVEHSKILLVSFVKFDLTWLSTEIFKCSNHSLSYVFVIDSVSFDASQKRAEISQLSDRFWVVIDSLLGGWFPGRTVFGSVVLNEKSL